MDLGIIIMIGVAVAIVAAAIWLAIRGRRTRSLPGDPHTSFHGDRAHSEASAGAYVADSVRDGGGPI
ncbi:hypothetical protein [Agromyces sp. NPDC058064]|uniref:hypothetical protein n=1 Tax=Agromyces sp. NPDC058064 TaxID=3346322 RepID=UPI0036D99E19